MLDFTSALYLGFRHDSGSLSSWSALTTGVPAALVEPPGAEAVAAALAERIGCRSALLGPSTLHLFHDVFELLSQEPITVLLDAGVYPIARWGAERAALAGAPVREVPHYDPRALQREVASADRRRRLVVVADGFCPGCGRVAPLKEYLAAARARDGWLVIDDTQALGIWGRDPEHTPPYGRGGGGSLARCRVAGDDVIVVSSLAKGLGAPVAVVAGEATVIARLAEAPTRVHCSPPPAAAIRAAEHALTVEARRGGELRRRLARVVRRFREGLSRIGLTTSGGPFPIQRLEVDAADVLALHKRLLSAGIRTVVLRARCSSSPALSFVFTARHGDSEIDTAVDALALIAGHQPTREPCIHSSRPSNE